MIQVVSSTRYPSCFLVFNEKVVSILPKKNYPFVAQSFQIMKKFLKSFCICRISRYVPKAHNCLIDDLNDCPIDFLLLFFFKLIFLFFAVLQ